jgi:hypothetical protein
MHTKFVRKPEGKWIFQRLGERWKDNIEVYHKEMVS